MKNNFKQINDENKLRALFDTFNFSNEYRLTNVRYDSAFFGNFLFEIEYGTMQFRIINDRNLLFIEKYNIANIEWEDVGFTSLRLNANNLKEVLYSAFGYIENISG